MPPAPHCASEPTQMLVWESFTPSSIQQLFYSNLDRQTIIVSADTCNPGEYVHARMHKTARRSFMQLSSSKAFLVCIYVYQERLSSASHSQLDP